ncbi:MAG: hypothetical protein ACJAU2_001788 [Maribacter sp.]|jgi:hypothetical protein
MKNNRKLFPKKTSIFPIFLSVLLMVSVSTHLTSQETSFKAYSGEILDTNSKKPLVFASLTLEGTNISTVTNTDGEFLLKVPKKSLDKNIIISFLGYKTLSLTLSKFKAKDNKVLMTESAVELSEVQLSIPKNPEALVRETLRKKGENYMNDPTVMTAFYRETIKKRNKNVSLSEAVVNIYKAPYSSYKRDELKLYKARKSTDYNKLDTLALKLQGGPFNTLFVDMVKYPDYIFTKETINYYDFTFDSSTWVNDKLIYIINFQQKAEIIDPFYTGKLFIDAENKILTSAIYALNITNRKMAAQMFVRKKPRNANVWPTKVAYRVDYREKDGKWYYGYSNVLLEFKIDWDNKLFNSVYSMSCEMAVTDWKKNLTNVQLNAKERLKSSIILSDEAIGFADPDFWGEYNIIEPEKSIESAIKKIQRQLRRNKTTDSGTSIP